MTNPHTTEATAIDIAASGDRIVGLIRNGQVQAGLALLQETREAERRVVQEALDRHVAAGAMPQLRAHAFAGRLEAPDRPIVERLQQALGPPRMPEVSHRPDEPNELVGLTDAQKYDIYASAVSARGNGAAQDDLQRNHRSVLLGLRKETSTLASPDGGRAGTGLYDDQLVVLTRTANGEKRIFIASRASTEPTAQYSHHAGSDGNRVIVGQAQRELRRLAPAPGYEDVRWRAIQGEDVNGDTMRDLGRLVEGTYELRLARHENPTSARTRLALRPSDGQLTPERSRGLVERDTNGDGLFTAADPNGVQDLNPTFKIHSGSRQNTDSAGCQTIHPDDYLDFINAVRTNQDQELFQYVLTSTHDGPVRELGAPRNAPHQVEMQEVQQQRGYHRGHVPETQEENRPQFDGGAVPRFDQQGNPQAPAAATPGPFSDEGLNRYYAAVLAGEAAQADRIALGFASRFPTPGIEHPAGARANAGEVATQREPTAEAHVPGLQV